MTKNLNTLIKLHKRELDTLRREMVVLETRAAELQAHQDQLAAEIIAERNAASKDPDAGAIFASYLQRTHAQQKAISRSQDLHAQEIAVLNGRIAELFAEVKKYEILRDIKQEQAKKDANRLERIELDDIASDNHQRKKQPHSA